MIEGDAEIPYRKLLEVVPFSETDRRHWVAFLAAQMFRTPWFLVQSLAGLRDIVATRDISYPTDVASLRRAHETMFTNPGVLRHDAAADGAAIARAQSLRTLPEAPVDCLHQAGRMRDESKGDRFNGLERRSGLAEPVGDGRVAGPVT